jgi:hypothetical protein
MQGLVGRGEERLAGSSHAMSESRDIPKPWITKGIPPWCDYPRRRVIMIGRNLDLMCAASINSIVATIFCRKPCSGATMRRGLGGCRLLVVGSDAIADHPVHKLLQEQGANIFDPFTSLATARAGSPPAQIRCAYQ